MESLGDLSLQTLSIFALLSLSLLSGCALRRPSAASLGTPAGFLYTGTITGATNLTLISEDAMVDLAARCASAAVCIGPSDAEVWIRDITVSQYIQKSGRALIVVEPSKKKRRWHL